MNQKEKLIEIINNVIRCDKCGIVPEWIAEDLIFYGVTVQEWVSVDDRLPDEPMRCLVYTKRGKYWGYEITYYNQGFYTQYAETIYWMPIPQPPKGE